MNHTVFRQDDSPTTEHTLNRRLGSFAFAMLAIGLIWLVALPWIGDRPGVSDHIATQQHLGIDPSALFYTELEIAPAIAHHIERLHDSYSDKFWIGSLQNPKRRDVVSD